MYVLKMINSMKLMVVFL